jgi:hypothetical protein
MPTKNLSKKSEKMISLTLFIAIILIWAVVLLVEIPFQETPSLEADMSQSFEGCVIEYGFSKCIDGNLVTPFYNPGTEDISFTSIHFYDGEDVDKYNCKEPLLPLSTEVLTTIPCTEDIDTSDVVLEWCCGSDCHETNMETPSTDLSIVRTI